MIFTEDIRKEIDNIDKAAATIFEKRMKLSKEAAKYKLKHGLPVLDEKREKSLIQKNIQSVSEEIRPYYAQFLQNTLSLSRRYQLNLLSDNKRINIFAESGSYPVVFGSADKLPQDFSLNRKCLIVTDENIPAEYIKMIKEQCASAFVFKIPAGEKSKNKDELFSILEVLLQKSFDRSDCIIALGGGVVGDIAGFSASMFMRGIDFYNIPTSLLAMVDACVGGKTAINFGCVKNIAGAFYQPKAVLIDISFLETLPEREFNNGMSEVIKTAALFDEAMFSFIERNDRCTVYENIETIIRQCIIYKKEIIEKDEKEAGIRKCLNFGHTLGHSIEASDNSLLHGECISHGMLFCSEGKAKKRLENVLGKFRLLKKTEASNDEICKKIMHDKKSDTNEIVLVKVKNIGSFEFEKAEKISLTEEIMKEG